MFCIWFSFKISRTIHNSFLFVEESNSSDFEDEITALNMPLRKSKNVQPHQNYFQLFDDKENLKQSGLKKLTVEKVLNLFL